MSSRKTDFATRTMIRAASLAILIFAWAAAAGYLGDPQTLPGPIRVFNVILQEAENGELGKHLLATLFRVVCAFALAMAVGLTLGLLMGRKGRADEWLDTWLVVLLNLPALVTIVLCYLWIGLTEIAAIVAVAVNKIPLVTVMIREGARALDTQLDHLAKVFQVSRSVQLRHILLPQLTPQIAAASRSGIALIWKIVLVVEFLGRPNGIGFQIHLGFQLFDVALVLAYAIAFIIVMLLIETFVVQPFERHANRWRAS